MPADTRFHDPDVLWALLQFSWRFHANDRSWARLRRPRPDDARDANPVPASDARQIDWCAPRLTLTEAEEALHRAERAEGGRAIDDPAQVREVLAQAAAARAGLRRSEALHGEDPEDAQALKRLQFWDESRARRHE